MRTILPLLLGILLFQACSQNNKAEEQKPAKHNSTHMLLSTAWYQKAAERKALYYQAYNIARLRIDQISKHKNTEKQAVVLDIDETVLDNSPYQGWCVKEDSLFSKTSWNRWVQKEQAEVLTGALDFTQYAKAKGIEVFYISNRHVSQLDATINNLREKGFPNAQKSYILLKDSTSDKRYRRGIVEEDFEIALLIGDNLGDFDNLYDNRSNQNAHRVLEEQKNLFGKKFIILPNPMYGKWERPFQKMEGDYINNLKQSLDTFEY